MTTDASGLATPKTEIGFKQFVGLVAAIMAMNAISIDIMLPALATIGDALHIPTANGRQWIVTAYLLGFGAAQLIYGPLSDRFGRKPVLMIGITIYVACSLMAALSTSMEMMMIARATQGIGAAASRIMAVSIVRDRYSGRQMARVMSLVFIVFLATPIIAPSLGQLALIFVTWRSIFIGLACYGILVGTWIVLRLPETQHPEDRRPISLESLAISFRFAFSHRVTNSYMMASTFATGGLFGFINSAQQVFTDIFHMQALFPSFFALIAGAMAASSFLNSRIVGKFGTRVMSHSAMLGYLVVASIHALIAFTGHESIVVFVVFQACIMFCFGLMGANFGAMAMEPMGHIAGTASSVQGFVTTVGGAILGFSVGQSFDGTVKPFLIGLVTFGALVIVSVLIAEKGRLFRPTVGHAAAAAAAAPPPGDVKRH